MRLGALRGEHSLKVARRARITPVDATQDEKQTSSANHRRENAKELRLVQETWPTPTDNDKDSHRHNRGSNPRLVDTARGPLVWPPPPPAAAMHSSGDSVGGGVVCLQFLHLILVIPHTDHNKHATKLRQPGATESAAGRRVSSSYSSSAYKRNAFGGA